MGFNGLDIGMARASVFDDEVDRRFSQYARLAMREARELPPTRAKEAEAALRRAHLEALLEEAEAFVESVPVIEVDPVKAQALGVMEEGCTEPEPLAAELRTSPAEALKLLRDLEDLGLCETNGEAWKLHAAARYELADSHQG